MERKIAKMILGISACYVGTLYLIWFTPSMIRYLIHRANGFKDPEAYIIFNVFLLLIAYVAVFFLNAGAFILTSKLY